jgi:hypothetical protein
MTIVLSGKSGGGGGSTAALVSYDNSTSGLTATEVQGAIDELAASPGGLFDAYALLRDEKAAGTDGGSLAAATWATRTLNTESFDPGGIVTLAANQFTLQAGTYYLVARAPAFNAGSHKLKIRNITDSTDAVIGSTTYTITTNNMTDSWCRGRITIAAAKAFELQHHLEAAPVNTAGGEAGAGHGVVEVYSEVEIWREAA